MFKKYNTILLLIFMANFLSSCNIGHNNTINSSQSMGTNPQLESKTYDLLSKNYINADIKISYPQLVNLYDTKKQNDINDLIKNEALKVLNYYKDSEEAISLEIKYETICRDENLMSIQYTGLGEVKNSAHPNNLFFTTNVSIKDGKKVTLTDVINVNSNLVKKLKNGDFTVSGNVIDKAEIIERINNNSDEELINMLINADSLDNIGTEKQSDVFTGFKKDSLVISFSVPHSLGDHIEIEIKYDVIKDNFKNGIKLQWLYKYYPIPQPSD